MLVDRSPQRIQLTHAVLALLEQAKPMVDGLLQTRERLRRAADDAAAGPVLRLGTGTALARTLVADWLLQLGRLRQPLHRQEVVVSTGSMADIGLAMERGSLDLMICHHHPVSTIRLNNQRFFACTARGRVSPRWSKRCGLGPTVERLRLCLQRIRWPNRTTVTPGRSCFSDGITSTQSA